MILTVITIFLFFPDEMLIPLKFEIQKSLPLHRIIFNLVSIIKRLITLIRI